jgi:hypothetical protein
MEMFVSVNTLSDFVAEEITVDFCEAGARMKRWHVLATQSTWWSLPRRE